MTSLFIKKYLHLFGSALLTISIACCALIFRPQDNISLATREIVESPTIDTTFPSWAAPNPQENITDLSYWTQKLPHTQDKTAAGFVVYPKVGVIVPLVWPDASDVQKIQVGELFNHYKYLEDGALHYVGKAPDQGVGNMVLAAHSSFAKNDPGRYKTVGQVAPLTNEGDKIFVYLADDQARYTLYVYQVDRSEEIPETEVTILNQQVAEKSLTLFTCYPIGTTDARRVNQATLVETVSSDQRTVGSEETPSQEQTHHAADLSDTFKSTFTTQSTAPTTKKTATTNKKSTNNTSPNPTSGLSTSSTISTSSTSSTISTSSTSSTISTSSTSSPIKPTFKERVVLRPVVYRTTIKLISTIGFKRSNLVKLVTALDIKIASLSKDETAIAKNKKNIVAFILIKELIEGFMK